MTRSYCATIKAEVPDPCPRKAGGKCADCWLDLAERSALIEFGGMGLDRVGADRLAARQLAENLRTGEQGMLL